VKSVEVVVGCISGVSLGLEVVSDEGGNYLVFDLLIVRVIFAWLVD
jgi:hypothetical protein